MSIQTQIKELNDISCEMQRKWVRAIGIMSSLDDRLAALEQAAKEQSDTPVEDLARAMYCHIAQQMKASTPVAPVKPGRWKPEMGEDYWTTGRSTIVGSEWMNDKTDNFRWLRGDVYPTEAAAQYADDRTVALQAMHDWADARFVPDWEDFSQTKFAMSYNYRLKAWDVNDWHEVVRSDWPVFATEADFTEFMAEFGDRMHFLLERTKP